jgi:hypothetical protein
MVYVRAERIELRTQNDSAAPLAQVGFRNRHPGLLLAWHAVRCRHAGARVGELASGVSKRASPSSLAAQHEDVSSVRDKQLATHMIRASRPFAHC